MNNSYTASYYSDTLQPGDKQSGKGLQALTLLSLVGFCLVTLQGLLTHDWWFFDMLSWNLFLAWFPLGVVLVLRDLRIAGFRNNWLLGVSLLVWLVFLPNAPYIITDLYHIKHIDNPLLWFDTITLFLFALTGLLIGLYSVLIVHRMLRPLVGSWTTWAFILFSQLLSGFGIYLGRMGRWNSWDVLTKPSSLTLAIARAYHDHLSIKLTLGYGFVLAVMYVAFYWYVEQQDSSTKH